nr:hypothetical protein BaRGS_005534 [Batillaria attramentaria]
MAEGLGSKSTSSQLAEHKEWLRRFQQDHQLNFGYSATVNYRTAEPGMGGPGQLSKNSLYNVQINETVTACSTWNCDAGCIRDLRLQDNEIVHLHRGAFTNLTCLQSLNLANNRITNITLAKYRPFDRLVHLNRLDLHGNPLGSLPNSILVETHFPHLRSLDLSFCELEFVGEIAIDEFGDLEVLNMSNNRLTQLHGQTFQGYKALRFLDLSFNQLLTIQKDTFGDMMYLAELRLEHNKLSVISDSAFHADTRLSVLALSGNQFSSIPYSPMRSLRSLKKVDASFNPVMRLGPTHELTTVEDLKLDHLQNLTTIEEGAFHGFQRLQNLSLRFARGLTNIPAGAFRGNFSSLRQVLLDHNGLRTLHKNMLPWQQLTVLTLHDNHWHCDCTLGWATENSAITTPIRCEDPYRLQGQILNTLKPGELSCPRSLIGVKIVVGLALVTVATIMLQTFKSGYRRLTAKDTESTQDLTLASQL